MPPRNAVILGCTGLVGRAFVRRLAVHPWFRLVGLVASARSAGRRYGELFPNRHEEWPRRILEMPIRNLDELDCNTQIVFSALPRDIAGPVESGLRQRGLLVFSNALATAGITLEGITPGGAAASLCLVIPGNQAVRCLQAIHKRFFPSTIAKPARIANGGQP
ncbi:MAG: hypothetical protein JXA62_09585 [Candidatus Aminicenantes bacterium]|nr:hypothetical protein [Candidatus Aminicenantes bacterium]